MGCVCLKQTKGQKAPTIELWDVLDLKQKPMCSVEGCKKGATLNANETPYCTAHGKKSGAATRPKALGKTALGKMPKEDLVQTMGKHGMQQVDPKAKKQQLVDMFDAYLAQKYATSVKSCRATHLPLPLVVRRLVEALDKIPLLQAVDHVVIEQQMKARMTAVGTAICAYFNTKYPKVSVEFVSARHKLTVGGAEQKQRSYKQRKADGIALCRQQLGAGNPWLKTIDAHEKKDDLADCYLQGVWWLSKKAPFA